ncbi:MAG: hypothetical protein D6719_10910 [Candidatus Dadabacteria bacterium]|nr:MAG: hypothetical protein D6719_10910 [Candidatus Dadabacteria bacterium]
MKSSTAQLIKATLSMYFVCLRTSLVYLAKNPLFVVFSVVAFLLYKAASTFFAPFGFGGGFLVGFIEIALLAYFYSWLADIRTGEKLVLDSFLRFDYGMFFNAISVAFIIFLVRFFVMSVAQGSGNQIILMCFDLGVLLIFNAVPEVVVIHRFEGINALSHALTFTRDNWIEWYLPYVLIIAPVILALHADSLAVIAMTNPLLPVYPIVLSPLYFLKGHFALLAQLFGVVLACWFMIFRSLLFEKLESGTRRQRAFQAKFE